MATNTDDTTASGRDRDAARAGRVEPADDLPAVTAVRPHAAGGNAVVVGFENGAELRYRTASPGDEGVVRETWVGPDGECLRRERTADAGPEALALRSVGAYCSFDDSAHAAFVWGEANVRTLLGER